MPIGIGGYGYIARGGQVVRGFGAQSRSDLTSPIEQVGQVQSGAHIVESRILAKQLKVDCRGQRTVEQKGGLNLEIEPLPVVAVVLPVKRNDFAAVENVVQR